MAAPGFATIILWHWPEGETLSHGAFNVVPRRDIGHPAEKHRFVADVPLELLRHFGRDGSWGGMESFLAEWERWAADRDLPIAAVATIRP